MSSNKSFSVETSERYSRALFEVSKETNELDKVENNIKKFQDLINENSEIKSFIKDPTQSINQQNIVITLIAKHLGFSKNLTNFFIIN